MVHGDPKSGGRGQGIVLLSAILCDASFPIAAAKCGLFEPGEMIGLRSDAEVVIQSCEFSASGGREELGPNAIRIALNSGHELVLHMQGNRGSSFTNFDFRGFAKNRHRWAILSLFESKDSEPTSPVAINFILPFALLPLSII